MDILKIRGISLFVVALCLLILSLIVWQKTGKDKIKFWLGLSAFFAALYSFFCGGTYFFWNSNSILSVYWYRTTWLGVFLLPPFIIFTYYFVQNLEYLKLKAFALYLGAVVISYLALTTNLIVKSVYFKYPNISSLAGKFDFLGRLYIFLCVALFLSNILKEYFKSSGFKRLQLQYFILGIVIFFGAGVIATAVIPLIIGESPYYDIAAYASFVWVVLTAMAILRYRLFNIKVITTELFTFLIWILILAYLMSATILSDKIFLGTLFVFFSVFGALLIWSVIKEAEQKESLQKLTLELEMKNKKLQELDKLKSEFLSFAAHQVKSPMSVVKGYAELVLDGTITGKVKIKDIAQKIKNLAGRMIILVNNLLDSRRIEEGKMEYNFEEADIVGTVKNIMEEMKPLAKEKKLEFIFESGVKKLSAIIDIQKFSQVIQNLVDNAIKYTDAGQVRVAVDKQGGKALISVADSGAGISDDLMPKIFMEFERGNFKDKAIQGTGLGLYIAKQIVLAHKGGIWAESKGEGEGTKFFIEIPLVV